MGGSKHQLTQTETAMPAWLQPYANQYLQQYSNVTMPGGQVAGMPAGLNQSVEPFSQAQQQGLEGMIRQAGQPQELTGATSNLAMDTIGGKYLDPSTNPYLKSTYDQAAKGVTDQYQTAIAPGLNAEAMRAGAMGGSAYNQAQMQNQYGLGQNLSSLANDVYGGNYQAERGRQMQAGSFLPQLLQAQYDPFERMIGAGGMQQEQGQLGRDTSFQNALRQTQFPLEMLDAFGGALGAARGPGVQGWQRNPIRTGALGFK